VVVALVEGIDNRIEPHWPRIVLLLRLVAMTNMLVIPRWPRAPPVGQSCHHSMIVLVVIHLVTSLLRPLSSP
jgi:hypothetical protein